MQNTAGGAYGRLTDPDPSRENQIIMFKSCYPNSFLEGQPGDAPTTGSNPLRGQDCGSEYHTVGNAKGIYNDLLGYFATRQDKLFVAITAPPVQDSTDACNARAFNAWLVEDWLDGYAYENVAVFDFYNVLTSNGGSWDVNDLGWETGNHHRYRSGAVEYVTDQGGDVAAYPDGGSDNHPSPAGNQKATGEFVRLLNVFYHRWMADERTPVPTATRTSPGATATLTPTATRMSPGATKTPTRTTAISPTPVDTPLGGQHTVVFQQGVHPDPSYAGTADVILAREAEPNANLGGVENLEVFFGDVENRRSLMRWDLSSLPSDITVNGAHLELYRYDGDAASDMPLALYRVTRNWEEGTGWEFWPEPSYVPDGATWLIAAPGTEWTTAGGDYDVVTDYGHGPNGIVGQTTLAAGMGNGWFGLDATGAVRAWLQDGALNFGVLLRPLGGQYTYHYFHSRNHDVPDLRPRLVVAYSVGVDVTPTSTATEQPAATHTPTPTEQLAATHTPTEPIIQIPRLYLPIILKRWRGTAPGPTATPSSTPVSTGLDAQLRVREWLGVDRAGSPVTSGIPVPRELQLTDLSVLRLVDSSGDPVPAQFTPLARWGGTPDDTGKPVRWLLLDFQSDVSAHSTALYRLVDSGGTLPSFPTLTLTDGTDAVAVDTGAATFGIRKSDGGFTAPGLSAPVHGRLRTLEGVEYVTSGPVNVTVALDGPMRASVCVEGAYRDEGGAALLDYTNRYWFYAGQPTVRLFQTVENNNLCPLGESEQLQCHDIGSGGSVNVADMSMIVPFDLDGSLIYRVSGAGGSIEGSLTEEVVLYQDSSGTDHWDHYPTMTDWDGSPLDARPRMAVLRCLSGLPHCCGRNDR